MSKELASDIKYETKRKYKTEKSKINKQISQ